MNRLFNNFFMREVTPREEIQNVWIMEYPRDLERRRGSDWGEWKNHRTPDPEYKKWINKYRKLIKKMTEKQEEDEDFRVIPPLPPDRLKKRTGVQCGLCGMKFEDGKSYLYSCSRLGCPIFRRVTY